MKIFNSVSQAIDYINTQRIDEENKDFMQCQIEFLNFLDGNFNVIEIKLLDDEENNVDIKFVLRANVFINGKKSDLDQIEFGLQCYPLDIDEEMDLDITLFVELGNSIFHTHFYNLEELKNFLIEIKKEGLKIKKVLQKALFGNDWKVVREEIYVGNEVLDIVSYPFEKVEGLIGKLFNKGKQEIKEELIEIKFN